MKVFYLITETAATTNYNSKEFDEWCNFLKVIMRCMQGKTRCRLSGRVIEFCLEDLTRCEVFHWRTCFRSSVAISEQTWPANSDQAKGTEERSGNTHASHVKRPGCNNSYASLMTSVTKGFKCAVSRVQG